MVMIFSKYESSIYMEIALIIEIGNIEMRQNIFFCLDIGRHVLSYTNILQLVYMLNE